MRWTWGAVLILFLGVQVDCTHAPAGPGEFAAKDAGKLPNGWVQAQTGQGSGSVWRVVSDPTAPSGTGYVLAQTASGPARLFNLAIMRDSRLLDGTISVQFKAISGKIDQGGGILWRCQDPNNYYVCRFNPLESNFRLYKVIDGRRTQLASKEDIHLPADAWHRLTLAQHGPHIQCWLDSTSSLESDDQTITQAGQVGLWTKADAQTRFDQLTIRPQ